MVIVCSSFMFIWQQYVSIQLFGLICNYLQLYIQHFLHAVSLFVSACSPVSRHFKHSHSTMHNRDGGSTRSRENLHGKEAGKIFQLDRHRNQRFAAILRLWGFLLSYSCFWILVLWVVVCKSRNHNNKLFCKVIQVSGLIRHVARKQCGFYSTGRGLT